MGMCRARIDFFFFFLTSMHVWHLDKAINSKVRSGAYEGPLGILDVSYVHGLFPIVTSLGFWVDLSFFGKFNEFGLLWKEKKKNEINEIKVHHCKIRSCDSMIEGCKKDFYVTTSDHTTTQTYKSHNVECWELIHVDLNMKFLQDLVSRLSKSPLQ